MRWEVCLLELSKEIKSIRQKSLLSQSEFAKELGVSFSTVNRWENCKSVPNYQALKKIKNFCQINKLPFNINEEVWEEK